jgi:periplasmic copper chaperone A
MRLILALAASLLLAGPVLAHEFKVGTIEIIHPNIPEPSRAAKSAGGYMTIVNSGTEADHLIGIETALAAKAEVHESKVDADGIGTMERALSVEIPAGETVELQHGGFHVMFMGLNGPLMEGEMQPATLIFEKAGRVEIDFMIEAPAGMGTEMDHSKMDHSAMTGAGTDDKAGD